MSILRKIFNRINHSSTRPVPEAKSSGGSFPVSREVEKNLRSLTRLLNNTEELQTKTFSHNNQLIGLAYLESMVNSELLQTKLKELFPPGSAAIQPAPFLPGQEKPENLEDSLVYLTRGFAVLFVEGEESCFYIPAARTINRPPLISDDERSLKGPYDGFTEDVLTNLYLIRSKLPDTSLQVRKVIIGTRSRSEFQILYLPDLARPEIVETILDRMRAIKVDETTCCSEIAQYIEDSWLSPFPQLEPTKRPDVVVSALCQGRVAIVHPISPTVLLAPTVFFDLLDVPDDYYLRWSVSASVIRFIRLVAIIFATFLPSLYIALTAYNPDFIPTSLALLVAASREGVPFPIPVEAFVIVSMVEITREAIFKLPSFYAQIIGIAGLITLLGASIHLNLVSSAMVIVIVFSIICSTVVRDNDLRISFRELQFFFMIMASFLGIFGAAMAFFYTAVHMVTLKSFGIPYLSPMAPFNPRDWLRILFRFPAWAMPRLKTYHSVDSDRMVQTADRKEGEPTA